MNIEQSEYLAKVKELQEAKQKEISRVTEEARAAISELSSKYAESLKNYRVGAIVSTGSLAFRIDKITYFIGATGLPELYYKGIRATAKGALYKSGEVVGSPHSNIESL